jgi:hypothetical protein
MQIPLLSGISATQQADFSLSYPINLEGVPVDTGLSKGYLRSAAGAVPFATGPGVNRGGIEWNGVLYRVMGSKLVSVAQNGAVTILGDVEDDAKPVSFDYGFDRLAVRSNAKLWYWDGIALTQVTDPDLGPVLDLVWMNGHYVTTDGTSIVVTQLSDPTAVDPLKYGSAEADPDMVTGLVRLRNELYATGQDTIQVLYYVGGSGFPFAVNDGATIPLGCVGPKAKALYMQSFAFVGAGRNQGTAVWLAQGGTALKLSTRAIDDFLAQEADPGSIVVEARVSRDEHRLLVHLTGKTLVFLDSATRKAGEGVWYVAASGTAMDKPYRLRDAILCYGKWIVGDTESPALGVLDDGIATHFGESVGWQFDTRLLYNQGKGAILHTLELVGLPGRASGERPVAFLSYTLDGETWSIERAGVLGRSGDRSKRCQWRPHKRFSNYMGLRFRGNSDALTGWAGLEAEMEVLTV